MPTIKISELDAIGATPDPSDALIINDGSITKSVTVANLHSGLQSQIDAKQDASTALTVSTTFGGDVSGTYSAIVIADDSHNHIIGNVDGLQAELDAKQDASTALTTTNYSTTLDTRYYTETEIGTFLDGTTPISGYNKSNWDTAYGWGDHSLVGYLTSFTETDPVFSAAPASGITSTQITNWDTAYGWGDHASAGYLTGNQTITLSGDASGSGTTSIVVTVADDSHNHIIGNVDGLQAALDVKAPLASPSFTTQISLDGVAITDILDEDTMSSNSATALATQQSIKAYVDAQVATAGDGDGLAFAIALG